MTERVYVSPYAPIFLSPPHVTPSLQAAQHPAANVSNAQEAPGDGGSSQNIPGLRGNEYNGFDVADFGGSGCYDEHVALDALDGDTGHEATVTVVGRITTQHLKPQPDPETETTHSSRLQSNTGDVSINEGGEQPRPSDVHDIDVEYLVEDFQSETELESQSESESDPEGHQEQYESDGEDGEVETCGVSRSLAKEFLEATWLGACEHDERLGTT